MIEYVRKFYCVTDGLGVTLIESVRTDSSPLSVVVQLNTARERIGSFVENVVSKT